MNIQVNDFRWEPGKNDAEYIKLLESSMDEWKRIAQKAISKLKTLSKAQVLVRHSYWTTHRTMQHDGEWYCAACEYEPQVFENTPYCAGCGAKMDGGDKDG